MVQFLAIMTGAPGLMVQYGCTDTSIDHGQQHKLRHSPRTTAAIVADADAPIAIASAPIAIAIAIAIASTTSRSIRYRSSTSMPVQHL